MSPATMPSLVSGGIGRCPGEMSKVRLSRTKKNEHQKRAEQHKNRASAYTYRLPHEMGVSIRVPQDSGGAIVAFENRKGQRFPI